MLFGLVVEEDLGDHLLPTPVDDFDDSVLPGTLFATSIVVCMATLVFHLYQIVSLVVLFFVVNRAKSYWRTVLRQYRNDSTHQKSKLKKKEESLAEDQNQNTKDSSPEYPNESNQMEIRTFENNFRFLLRIESMIDYVVERTAIVRGDQRSSNSIHKSLQSKMMGGKGGELIINRVESQRKVIRYLARDDPDKHECRLCSVEYSVNRRAYGKSFACQLARLANHCLCVVALMVNYRQTVFYATGTIYLIISIPFVLVDCANKLYSGRNLQSSDICGYQKFYKLNEMILMLISVNNFVWFFSIYLYYCFRDDFIKTLKTDFFSNIY